jgi:hypothetical protein
MLLRKIGLTGHLLLVAIAIVIAAVGTVAYQDGPQPTRKPSRTSFSSSAKQVTEGGSVTVKAFVSAVTAEDGVPTGTVEFFDGATALGTVSLAATEAGNEASLTLSTLAIGPHPINAVYSGSTTFGGSVSIPEFVIVLPRQ